MTSAPSSGKWCAASARWAATLPSPASNPRQTWSKAKQAAFDDEYAARPAAIYPYKRKHWFEVCFRDEPAVRKAPPFGSVPTDFRPEED